jgi:hypothetical protein
MIVERPRAGRLSVFGILVAFLGQISAVGPASAASQQASWGRYSVQMACFANGALATGYINFCRQPGGSTSYVNYTGTRDSHLRSITGSQYDDRYTDNYIVGTWPGTGQPNTYIVMNKFTSTGIYVFDGTCYSGNAAFVSPGTYYPTALGTGLMSFRSNGAPYC